MTSTHEIVKNESDTEARAKAMAIKYQKYLARQKQSMPNKHVKCIFESIRKIEKKLSDCWALMIPKAIRGSRTPYQELIESMKGSGIETSEIITIPFCRQSISQSIEKHRINLIITYTEKSIKQTLQKINNNQQINSLINKKSSIFLLKMGSQQNNQVSSKIKDLIENLCQIREEQHVFVAWKGLFQEIVIIAHFSLQDSNLCSRIVREIEERQDYQQLVRKLSGSLTKINTEEQTLQKLQQQSTCVGRTSQE